MFRALSNAVRFLSISQVNNAGSGHLGMPLGIADVLTSLFKNCMVFDPENPLWPNRDRFVLSGGHGSSVLYSLLYLTGYKNITLNDLKNFRKLDSVATGHPEYNLECGIEVSTGALGQGIANAVGIAIEERILNARYGDECINHYTYACVGDGDLMEGVSHEACSLAGHLGLGRLIVLFDDNGITIDGGVSVASCEDVLKRFESYGWHTQTCDGHSEESVVDAINIAKNDKRPSIIACKTKIGFGSPREGMSKAHSGALNSDELRCVMQKLEWTCKPFEIPDYISKTWSVIGKRNHETCEKWYNEQSEKYGALEFEFTPELKKTLRNIKKEYFISRPFVATRNSSKDIIAKIMDASDLVISGSADLGSSTGCLSKNMKAITKEDFSGNYIHYGIREHAMGAIINGIVAGGKIRCFGGTFLSFCDYMRPAIRMSALMNIPSIFIFSHDSIGVGEDGPTHQPVEHLASLRCIPNLNVYRPADAMETMESWEQILKDKTPSVLILTRQDVLSVRFCGRTNLCENGGYLLYDDSSDCKQHVNLISSGSEVAIALEVKRNLNDLGISANVVSLPCWKKFDEQSKDYREHILGKGLRVGIEASNGFGWEKYLGDNSLFFGVNNFGKSCSCLENYNYFGLTSDRITKSILSKMEADN